MMAEIKFNPFRLEAIAASTVIDIFYSIQRIVRKYRHQLCFCHYTKYCNGCIILSYVCNFYKSFARRELRMLFADFNQMLKHKNELIKNAAFFDDENERAFFANKLPLITRTYCKPEEILYYFNPASLDGMIRTKNVFLLLLI